MASVHELRRRAGWSDLEMVAFTLDLWADTLIAGREPWPEETGLRHMAKVVRAALAIVPHHPDEAAAASRDALAGGQRQISGRACAVVTAAPLTYRGASLMQTDMPGGVWTWTHDETDGHATAETFAEARAQIDRHLSQHSARTQQVTPCP